MAGVETNQKESCHKGTSCLSLRYLSLSCLAHRLNCNQQKNSKLGQIGTLSQNSQHTLDTLHKSLPNTYRSSRMPDNI